MRYAGSDEGKTWTAVGNRVLIAEKQGREVAVATRTEPAFRSLNADTARLVAAAPDLLWLVERAAYLRNPAVPRSRSEEEQGWAGWDAMARAMIMVLNRGYVAGRVSPAPVKTKDQKRADTRRKIARLADENETYSPPCGRGKVFSILLPGGAL